MGSHVSGKLLAVYLLKQSALLSLRALTWMRNIVTEQLDEGHFALFQSSAFCILFHCDNKREVDAQVKQVSISIHLLTADC